MDPSNRGRRKLGVVAAGSVWETRMQSHNDEVIANNNAIVKVVDKETSLKRRTWKSDVKIPSSPEIDRRANYMKVTRARSIGATPPMTPRRSVSSSESNDKSLTVSVAVKKARSDSSVEGAEKTPGRVKKTRSELCTAIVKSGEFDSVALRKVNSLPARNIEIEKTEHVDESSVSELPEETVNEKRQIPEEVKEFGVCQEKIVSANEEIENGDHQEEEEEEEEEEETEEEEREVEKKSVDVKEINVAKENINNRVKSDVEINKFSQFHNRTAPSPSSVRKISPPVIKRATSVYSVPPKSTSSTDRFAEEEDNSTH